LREAAFHKSAKTMKQITEKEALLRLSALCSQAEHCTYEMEEKLRGWGMSEEVIARIVEYLVIHKFVDDERFAHAFAIDKIRYNKWGRRKVEQALWAKRISEDTRRAVLDSISDEEYMNVLRPLLRSKRKNTKASNDYELKSKLIRFAMGHGFTIDLIRQCLDGADDMDVEEYV